MPAAGRRRYHRGCSTPLRRPAGLPKSRCDAEDAAPRPRRPTPARTPKGPRAGRRGRGTNHYPRSAMKCEACFASLRNSLSQGRLLTERRCCASPDPDTGSSIGGLPLLTGGARPSRKPGRASPTPHSDARSGVVRARRRRPALEGAAQSRGLPSAAPVSPKRRPNIGQRGEQSGRLRTRL